MASSSKSTNVWSIILLVILALIVGTFVLRVFAWFMWHLFLPLIFGIIVIFIIMRLVGRK